MRKSIRVNNVKSTLSYLQLLNGIFKLTDTDLKFLAYIIDLDEKLSEFGFDVFSAEGRKKISEKMGWTNQNTCNQYIMKLKKKKILKEVDGTYKISPVLIPDKNQTEILIKYA